MMRVLSLFSGIGGFDLGLERTGGFHTVAFCENATFPRAILAKHWPGVPCYDDVRTLTGARLAADGIAVDAICGGFPCQGISAAGRGAGLADARSGLWSEYARIIGEVRPRLVLIENSPNLRTRGADRVCGDLEVHGYAWWAGVVGAVHVGAPHKRNRAWIVAHTMRGGLQGAELSAPQAGIGRRLAYAGAAAMADTGCQHGDRGPDVRARDGIANGRGFADGQEANSAAERRGEHVADPDCLRKLQPAWSVGQQRRWAGNESGDAPHTHGPRLEIVQHGPSTQRPPVVRDNAWGTFGGLGGTTDGISPGLDRPAPWERGTPRTAPRQPHRKERLTALGNAVVPQVAEVIGRAVLAMLDAQAKAAA